MSLGRLGRGELLAVAGGILLALGLFLPWYNTNPPNRNANNDGMRGSLKAWEAHGNHRGLLLAGAAAPLILAWVILRDHELSWPRGEMTAVVGMIALVLVLYVGLIDRPGEPSAQISLRFGWVLSLLGIAGIIVGGALRAGSTERPRKPPGVL
jgi:hypothetical protein